MKRVQRVFSLTFYIAVIILLCFALVLYFGKMDQSVDGLGMVSPGRRMEVSPQINGIVEKVHVAEGESVSINDTLLTIYSEEIELDVQRAGNILADAHSDLTRSEDEYRNLTTSRSYELGVILADLNEAEKRLKFSEENLERSKKLYEKGLINEEEFEREQLSYESNKSYYNVLKARSSILRKQLERRIEERRRNLELAESSYKLARSRLDRTTVVAPMAGVVLTAEPENLVGKMVNSGEPVLIIGCFDDFVFSVDIGEADITEVKPGQDAKIYLNSYPHREYKVFEGKVDRIASAPNVSKGRAAFEVELLIEEPWIEEENGERTALRHGLMGKAEIIIEPEVRLYKIIMDGLTK